MLRLTKPATAQSTAHLRAIIAEKKGTSAASAMLPKRRSLVISAATHARFDALRIISGGVGGDLRWHTNAFSAPAIDGEFWGQGIVSGYRIFRAPVDSARI